MTRSWMAVAALIAIIAGGTLALFIDWPNLPGSCDANWTRCEP